MSKLAKALTAAAGNAGESLYVEDVFSTYLYEGIYTASVTSQTITNNIDLAGEGGLVWFKNRTSAANHRLIDTERGGNLTLISNSTGGNSNLGSNGITSFNSNGWTMGTASLSYPNGNDFCSWTFRKAEKFFDVVTYTGSTGPVAHNLGSVPKVIMIKAYSGTYATNDWMVYHANVGAPFLNLNDTGAAAGSFWTTSITDTHFTPPGNTSTNGNGTNYVAYLFASDAGGFGDDGSESIIKCGSAAATGLTTVNCGFEPQWVLIKSATVSNSWYIFDSMRGLHATGVGPQTLNPNLSSAEYTESADTCNLTSTGFTFNSARFNGNATYIYIAIRRPMKTPESGTEVFNDTFQYGEDGKTGGYLGSPADLDIRIDRTGGGSLVRDRLRGDLYLRTQATDAEAGSQSATWDNMTGYFYYSPGTSANTNIIHYVFKRATGFFDVVAYTGDDVNPRTITHNLGAVPEMLIFKCRNLAVDWKVHLPDALGNFDLSLNKTNAKGANSVIGNLTSSTFTISSGSALYNDTSDTYIAYLFATLAGVSKVGSYTGNSSTQVIDCGFSTGARFVLIKAASRTGGWTIFDSARGITSSTADPFLYLNSTAAEQTNVGVDIDPDASGFELDGDSSVINESGQTYIFLAIA